MFPQKSSGDVHSAVFCVTPLVTAIIILKDLAWKNTMAAMEMGLAQYHGRHGNFPMDFLKGILSGFHHGPRAQTSVWKHFAAEAAEAAKT